MSMCPLCNQFNDSQVDCPTCQRKLEDQGRIMDYFDDYSPYLEIDGMKQADGYPSDLHNHQCPHLLKCTTCGKDHVVLINEWEL